MQAEVYNIFKDATRTCVGQAHASSCASKDATFLTMANMTYCD